MKGSKIHFFKLLLDNEVEVTWEHLKRELLERYGEIKRRGFLWATFSTLASGCCRWVHPRVWTFDCPGTPPPRRSIFWVFHPWVKGRHKRTYTQHASYRLTHVHGCWISQERWNKSCQRRKEEIRCNRLLGFVTGLGRAPITDPTNMSQPAQFLQVTSMALMGVHVRK